jgi:hypothetical protein
MRAAFRPAFDMHVGCSACVFVQLDCTFCLCTAACVRACVRAELVNNVYYSYHLGCS